MLVLHFEVTRTGTGRLNQRVWRGIKRRVWRRVAQYWIDEIRPKHFTKAGAREYGYKPRQGEGAGAGSKAFWRSYTGQKQRKKGHTRPLEWSGQLKTESRGSRIQASINGSTVFVRGRVLNLSGGDRIDMRREISAVSAGDVVAITRFMQRETDREMKLLDLRKDSVVIKVG